MKWNAVTRSALFALAALSLVACSNDSNSGIPGVDPNRAAPVVSQALPDFSLRQGSTQTLNLSNYFSDAQTPSISLVYTVQVVGNAATATVSGRNLSITAGNAAGTASMTVTATDADGNSVRDTFRVTVTSMSQNQPPALESPAAFGGSNQTTDFPLGTLVIKTGGSTAPIDLRQVFMDDATADDALSFSVQIADTSIATATLSGSTLRINGQSSGSTVGSIVVNDGEATAKSSRSFAFRITVSVGPAADPIPDQNLAAREIKKLQLDTYFADPDGGTMTYQATSNRTGVVTSTFAPADPQELLLTAGKNDGNATVSVTGTSSGGLAVTRQFAVVVTNEAPALISGVSIPDRTIGRNASIDMDLAVYVQDREDPAPELTVTGQSDPPGLATVAPKAGNANQTLITLTAGNTGGNGRVNLIVTDTGGKQVSLAFNLTVGSAFVSNPSIADFQLGQNAQAAPLDLAEVFLGPNYPTQHDLTFIVSRTNNFVSHSLVDNLLTITAGNSLGSTTDFTVTARDAAGMQNTISFTVTISSDAPQARCNFPATIPAPAGARPAFIDLETPLTGAACPPAPLMDEPTNDRTLLDLDFIHSDTPAPGTLTYSASSSDPTVMEVTLNADNQLRVLAKVTGGQARITVVATDADGNTVSQVFTVTNVATTVAPVFSAIPAVTRDLKKEAQTVVIELGDFVADANLQDNDDDTVDPTNCNLGATPYTYRITSNSNPGVVQASLGAGADCDRLTLVAQRELGSASIGLQVTDDDGDIATQTLSFNVIRPPHNLLVLEGTTGDIKRFDRANSVSATLDLNFPITPQALTSPNNQLGVSRGFVLDEAGNLYQAGDQGQQNCGSFGNRLTNRIRVLANALQRVPEPPAVKPADVAGAAEWAASFDRNVGPGVGADTACSPVNAPTNPAFQDVNLDYDSDRGVLIAARTAAAPAAGDLKVIFYASQVGTALNTVATAPLGGLTEVDLGVAVADQPIDVAFAEPAPSRPNGLLFVTVRVGADSRIVRCTNPYKIGGGAGCTVLDPTPACKGAAPGVCNYTGVAYVDTTDTLVVTDAGPTGSGVDGSIYVFHSASTAGAVVTPDLTISGANTCLTNPMDVAIDTTATGLDVLVADPTADPTATGACAGGAAPAGAVMRYLDAAKAGSTASATDAPVSAIEVASASRLQYRSLSSVAVPDASDADVITDNSLSTSATQIIVAGNPTGQVDEFQASFGNAPTLNFVAPFPGAFSTGVFGLAIGQAGGVYGSTRNGPVPAQPGGIQVLNVNPPTLAGTLARELESPAGTSATGLVAPRGMDLAEKQGVIIIADPRDPASSSAGAIQVMPYGSELANAKPQFTTLLADSRPMDVDYDAVNDRLYVALGTVTGFATPVTSGSIAIFDNYLASRPTALTAARVVTPLNSLGAKASTALTGIVALQDGTVLVTDNPNPALNSYDGQVLALRVTSTSSGNITADLELSIWNRGFNGLFDNPVDLAFDVANDLLYVLDNDGFLPSAIVYQLPLLRSSAGVISAYRDATANVIGSFGALQQSIVAVPDYLPRR